MKDTVVAWRVWHRWFAWGGREAVPVVVEYFFQSEEDAKTAEHRFGLQWEKERGWPERHLTCWVDKPWWMIEPVLCCQKDGLLFTLNDYRRVRFSDLPEEIERPCLTAP